MTIINEDTGTKREVHTSDIGWYMVPLLQPGRYYATVEQAGFRVAERKGLALHVDEAATLDFQLEVGSVHETVIVQGDASALDTSQASQGALIDNAKINDLPLNGRDPYALVALAPGVTPLGGFSTPRVFQEQAYQSDFTVNGGVPMTNDILLDGTSNTAAGHGQAAMTPSVDAIQEFKVQTASFSAEYGRTGGGIINIVTKSGGNQPHGTAYEFFRNNVLDGNNFFNNRAGIANPPFRFNDFGATMGGPVLLPKLYNGRNRTFFFVAYEGDRARRGQFFTGTVPTAAMRSGDFSQLKNAQGQLIVIYDPNTNHNSVRDPFPGNIIPVARQDKVAVNATKYYPLPNQMPNQDTGLVSNNFLTNAAEADDLDNWQWRVDHNLSSNSRLFVRMSHDKLHITAPNFYKDVAGVPNTYSGSNQPDWHGTVGFTQNFGANTLFDIRAGYARNGFVRIPTSLGFDPTQLGLPPELAQQAQVLQFPDFNPTGYSGVGAESNDMFFLGADTYSLYPQLTHIHGRHTLKFGGDYRVYRQNTWNPSNPTGAFNFSAAFTQGPNPNVSTLNGGDAYASMLLGAMSSASASVRAYQSYETIYSAEYLQDDFKVSSRLTLNLGVRYDYETPRTERFNRQTNFDYDVPSPIGPQVGLPNLKGGLIFDGVNGTPRGWSNPDRNNFAPRFGFAYHLTTNTVVRGGYGITYLPGGTTFNGYGAGQEGLSVTTSVATSVNNGLTAFTGLSDSFASGLLQPAGTSQGLLTELGLSVRGDPRWVRTGYLQVWSLNVQRQLPGRFFVEAGYAGSRGVKIPMTFQMDQLPDQYLSLGTGLSKQVPNPFLGYVSSGTLSLPAVSVGQLLRPYPQFNGVSFTANDAGSSTYHSLQVRVEKRLSHGLTFLAAYTFSKNITDVDTIDSWIVGQFSAPVQDSNNRRLDRSVATIDVPQRLVVNYVYELPFGQGKPLLGGAHGIGNAVVGGWRVTGITTFQAGRPLGLTTASNNTTSYGGGSRPNNNGQSAGLSDPTIAKWFNTADFSQPAPFTFGSTGRLLPDVREPGIANFDFTAQKNFPLSERFKLQFRAEFFNLTNTPQFGRPGQAFGLAQFGVISSQANNPRQIQFSLKLLW